MDRNFNGTFQSILGKQYPVPIFLARDINRSLGIWECRLNHCRIYGRNWFHLSQLNETCTQENLCPSQWPTGIGTVMLPAHGLIKLKFQYGFRLLRFNEMHLIKILFQPVRWSTGKRNLTDRVYAGERYSLEDGIRRIALNLIKKWKIVKGRLG